MEEMFVIGWVGNTRCPEDDGAERDKAADGEA